MALSKTSSKTTRKAGRVQPLAWKPRFLPNAQICKPEPVDSIQLPTTKTNWRRTSHTTTKGNSVRSYHDSVITWDQ